MGCEKVIEIPYRSIESIYVIEANISDGEDSSVRLSQTRDMDDSLTLSYVNSATVVVTDENGVEYNFVSSGYDGVYTPQSTIPAIYNSDYQISVEIDGDIYSATSHMHSNPIMSPINLTYEEFSVGFTMNMVFCSFSIYNQPLVDDDYYRYRITVNSYESGWVLVDDLDADQEWLFQFMPLINKVDGDLVDIAHGDTVRIDIQAIDKSVHNYFYTLDLSSSSGSNPTSNIEGGCLGYFSAYSTTTLIEYVDFDSL